MGRMKEGQRGRGGGGTERETDKTCKKRRKE